MPDVVTVFLSPNNRTKRLHEFRSMHYYTTDLSSIAQNVFSLGDFDDRN
jgi:hypothetical protein